MEPVAHWSTPLADAARMRALDAFAIERAGIPGTELMESAGTAVARVAEELAQGGAVVVLAGKGNNAGDGFVAARLLAAAGLAVEVLCTAARSEYAGDAAAALARLPDVPLRERCCDDEDACAASARSLARAAVIVDALLGTGAAGAPRGGIAKAIELASSSEAPVLAVDIPSGVDASSGEVPGAAISASATVTFQVAKVGLLVAPGKWHAGEVRVAPIGIPEEAWQSTAEAAAGDQGAEAERPDVALVDERAIALLPRRGARSNKFTSGHVLLVGGSPDLTGAVRLAAGGALRAGAGYLTACLPAALRERFASAAPAEVMTRALADDGSGHLALAAAPAIVEAARRGGALVLGNGIGRRRETMQLVRELAATLTLPLVLDADGLHAFAGEIDALAGRSAPTILTPHAGELARLLATESRSIETARLASVRAAARRARAIVALKGDDTLIGDPDGRVLVSPGGAPALASAGSGDVLAGVIGALLAAGTPPLLSAAAGVLMHLRAGQLAAARVGVAEAVLAGDVIDCLASARAQALAGRAAVGGR
ncbi:MAG TPA: NAD(P)H-hydrate dehydratase [Solirubrobacteraceae bacterium]|nr:NAD(P)H-hydrate dehydratase [Solirubrobacteraceae bacterium]